jgi:hypothetical protein
MVTDKDIVNYLKQSGMMGKAYIIDWFIRDLVAKNGNSPWFGGGTFVGYVKKNIFYREDDTFDASRVDNFIGVNYDTAKLTYDRFKEIKLNHVTHVLDRTYKR